MAKRLAVKRGVKPPVFLIVAGVVNAMDDLGLQQGVVITSGNDGRHMTGSRHYTFEAVDFRTKHLPREVLTPFRTRVKKRLGRDFDVILESVGKVNEHLHVEYDPKG